MSTVISFSFAYVNCEKKSEASSPSKVPNRSIRIWKNDRANSEKKRAEKSASSPKKESRPSSGRNSRGENRSSESPRG